MSTKIEGIYFNPRGNLPIVGVGVTAQSVDGYSEGSDTTDSNGHFKITGLTDRNWLAKATSKPPDFGVFYLIPDPVFHRDLASVTGDQHHAGFVGLLDSASNLVEPDSNDRIQITDDAVINADVGGEEGGILALTIDQEQIDHGSIGGIADDDHTRYADVGGRAGGQSIAGGSGAGEDLTLLANSVELGGNIIIGNTGLFQFDEDTGQLHVATTGVDAGIQLGGDALWYRSAADTMRTPDALVVDGISTLTGNVSVGGTVDGVDIAARDHAESHGSSAHSGKIGEVPFGPLRIPLTKALPGATNNATLDDDWLYKSPWSNEAVRISRWYVRFESNLAADATFQLYKNGSQITGAETTVSASGRDASVDSFTEQTLADGDYLEVFQTVGNAEDIGGSAYVYGDQDVVTAVTYA